MTSKSITAWFHKTLGVNATPASGEIQTYCPRCGGEVFYFNVYKQVGICHKASCNFRPSLDDLIAIVGYGPDESGFYEPPTSNEKAQPDIELPGWPVLQVMNGKFMTSNDAALEYLRSRHIPDEVIVNWGITCDGERVYVPIKSEGTVKNFNSRVLPGVPGRKYLYAPGASTSLYILGWEEAKLWNRLSLVENTFVSLALRSVINTSTVFGSRLSDTQADMIAKSKVKEVAILWDEGAEKKAEQAVMKLHSRGVNAAYWMIEGQPDDHPLDWVAEKTEMVYSAARIGLMYLDLRGY